MTTTGATIHVIQYGETLSTIAARYDTTVEQLATFNGITNPNRIYAGQRLVIPQSQTVDYTTYTVQAGDLLSTIAARYGTTVEQLASLNGIYPPYLLVLGQTLRIPITSGGQPPPTGQFTNYTIQPGDYLLAIALKSGVNMEALATLNNLKPPYALSPGQVIKIPASSSGQYQTHTVKPGEYLLAIALKYRVSMAALAALNGIQPPFVTTPGQVLRIPKSNTAAEMTAQSIQTQTPAQTQNLPVSGTGSGNSTRTHTVQPGEYILAIASKYGVSVEALAAANNIQPPYALTPGQVLQIP